jgi:hypothetical protein
MLPRQRAFATAIFKSPKTGQSQAACYASAGYRAEGHAAEVNASRLLKNAEVQAMIDQLARPVIKKARVTIESLLDQLDETITAARADGQHNVVVNALTLSAKLVGLLRERIEVGGAGEFAGAKDASEIVAIFISEMGSPAEALLMIEDMRARVEALAADEAVPVS